VSRIERQRDGLLAAFPIAGAAPLGMMVWEDGQVGLEVLSIELRVAVVEIFIARIDYMVRAATVILPCGLE
jgi:hypothetical protein